LWFVYGFESSTGAWIPVSKRVVVRASQDNIVPPISLSTTEVVVVVVVVVVVDEWKPSG
jgi:hypothetical protein